MPPPAARRDPFLGIVLDEQYELLELIARGGMGRIYRALQRSLDRQVAVKVLDMEQLGGAAARKDFERRFSLEAASCAKLKHPNTVVVYDYGRADNEDVFYIVMELLDGTTLQELLEESGPMTAPRAIHVALQVAGSLGEAHENGMVHRDLKPSNVMLMPRGADPDYVKVLDFGLVKAEDTQLTQSGALLGTPRYMAPEQIANDAVGPAADIYGLGATLYHMLAGRPPFDSDSKFVLLAAHMNVPVPPIREVAPGAEVSAELEAVVMRCLAKEPEDRFASMEALARALSFCPEDTKTSLASMPRAGGGARNLSHPGAERRSAADPLASTSAERPAVASISGANPRAATTGQAIGVPDSSPSLHLAPAQRRPLSRSVVLAGALVTGATLAGVVYAFTELGADDDEGATTSVAPPDTSPEVRVAQEPRAPVPAVNSADTSGAPRQTAPVGTPEAAWDRVTIQTDPEGAHLRRGDEDLGDAPTMVMIPRGESWLIDVSAAGHQTRSVQVTAGRETVTVRLERLSRRRTSEMASPSTGGPTAPPTTTSPPTPSSMGETDRAAPHSDNRDPWAVRPNR